MNIRWIGIILILIAGLSCMYVIVTHSNSVGSAVSVISDVTITLPEGYITSEDGSKYCVFFNKATNETIRIKCFDENTTYTNEYNKELDSLSKQDDIIVGKHFKNENISRIDYQNQSTPEKLNRSVVYFDKCNHTFSLKFELFTDENRQNDAMNFIIDTMKFDFKQNTA
jgi:hypothetical protein